jgi:hypothetical protein
MSHHSISRWTILVVAVLSWITSVSAHTIIVYPGYRGNNLHSNGTVEDSNGLGQAMVNGSMIYPYGMEWMYPCMYSHHRFVVLRKIANVFDCPRRRNALLIKPNQVACQRGSDLRPTGLVPRTQDGLYLLQSRSGDHPAEYEPPDDGPLPDHRPLGESLPGDVLSAPGAVTA